MFVINGKVDVDIKCVWCGEGFTLCKKEVWVNPYVCPRCKKPMGIPKMEYGTRYKIENGCQVATDTAHVNRYQFCVHVIKTKLLTFLSELIEEKNGYCVGITKNGNKHDRIPWIVYVEAKKAFDMEGVEWKIPPMYHAV